MNRYVPKDIEAKWQAKWADDKLYQVTEDTSKKKIYAVPMLPYPSGAGLHTGHVRNYSIADAVARFHRQRGFNVLSAIGWDSFGLPAENYAIKTGTPPAVSTAKNVAYFKEQLQRVGVSFDWSREFDTSDPSYYKWTQWLFGLLYKRGLAYKAEKSQWWCEKCNTVLADEQVQNGKCWRHDGADDPAVTKRDVSQWFFKLTAYADEILDATDALEWPDKIKAMQKNWIGRKTGINITYKVTNSDDQLDVTCFTTRPDTNFGATFVVIAPEHELVKRIVAGDVTPKNSEFDRELIRRYQDTAARKSELDRISEGRLKTGVFTGFYVKNELNDTEIPVWISDFVLTGFGTGAVVGVPGHDLRDFEFATEFGLPIKRVVVGSDGDIRDITSREQVQEEHGKMVNSGFLDGMDIHDATGKIMDYMAVKGYGQKVTNFKVRDWLISRQRYWGAPVPIVYCPDHGAVLVPESQLPVQLPEVENYVPDGKNSSVLAGVEDWVNTTCPDCGKPAKRETDTMDGYVCSTWYLHRYTDARNDQAPFDPEKSNYWYPLDFYFGGDHAVAHLLYIRFFQRVLVDAGLAQSREPVKRLVYNGYINAEDGRKMSKSLGNTVDPMDIIGQGYGADALRVFELFIAPYDQDTPWNVNGVPGAYRFLNRVWVATHEFANAEQGSSSPEVADQILRTAHKAVKKVTDDLQNLSFNTAVAAMMDYTNQLYLLKAKEPIVKCESWQYAIEALVQVLAPFAPHITEELWQLLGHADSIHKDHWPDYDQKYLVSDTITIAVQVNGKVRAEIQVAADAAKDDVIANGLALENIQKFLQNKEPTKTIYVPGRILNFVG